MGHQQQHQPTTVTEAPPEEPEMVAPATAGGKSHQKTKYAFACAMLASMTSILVGYDIGVMSGAAIFIKDDLKISYIQVQVLVSILDVYSLIGSFAAGRTSDYIGRRYTILVAAAIFFVGALLMGFATNYIFLMIGRFVAGIGVGYALMIAPVYAAEVSPASSRGFLTSLPEVSINSGILLGYVSNFAFSKLPEHLSWRLMLGVGAIPSVFLAFGMLAMPESPRWLVMQGRLGEAKRVFAKTSESPEEAELRLLDIKATAGIPEDMDAEVATVPKRKSHGEDVWKELLIRPTPAVRRILICGVGIHFFQQATGIDSVKFYSPRVFEKVGLQGNREELGATVAVGFIKTIFILVAAFLFDRVGRRPLLLSSAGGMIVSLAGLGLGLTVIQKHNNAHIPWAIDVCISSIVAYVSFFSIGLGPITWVYSSEIFPLRLRAQGCAIGVVVNRVTKVVFTMTFISLFKEITIGGIFFLHGGIAVIAWTFFFTFLPETRGRTLENMDSLFVKSSDEKQKSQNAQGQSPSCNNISIAVTAA